MHQGSSGFTLWWVLAGWRFSAYGLWKRSAPDTPGRLLHIAAWWLPSAPGWGFVHPAVSGGQHTQFWHSCAAVSHSVPCPSAAAGARLQLLPQQAMATAASPTHLH